MKNFVIMFLLALVTSCSNSYEAVQESPTTQKEELDEKDFRQEFEVVHAYLLYPDFFKNAQGFDEAQLKNEFEKEILDQLYTSCLKDGEYLHLVEKLINEIPVDLARYEQLVGTMDQNTIEGMIMEALEKSSKLLPTRGKTTVCIFPSINKDAPAAVTIGSGKIAVLYSGFHSENHLKTAIAHEYHHSVWTENYFDSSFTPTTVLDHLVYEGKAVMFEKLVYPQFSFTAIDREYDKDAWNLVEKDMMETDYKKAQQILTGGNELPPFYGYSEGYKMVESFVRKEHLSIEEWTAVPAQGVFNRGKYSENYQQ